MKRIFVLLSLLSICISFWAQSPKREMRATWLATVYRLDWPSTRISSTGNTPEINTQKKQMIRILDSLAIANMNAVCFQVRCRADAMYKSSYEPWSADLVTVRGMEPGYDPLAFVIEEGHKRGIEVHAWVNPYRYESQAGQWSGMEGDFRATHPGWILTVNNAAIFDPGLPDVRNYITNVIKEMVTNYDIDGVLFDDYFYLQGIKTEDANTFANHNSQGLSLGDWRRDNVNKLIKQVYNMIQVEKPYVRFGVSPAGIWDVTAQIANSYGLELPEKVSGGYAYNGIYCDPVAWLQQGSVDYISPQIYWEIDSNSTHDYARLSPWWSNTALHFGKHFYSSHSIENLNEYLKSGTSSGDLSGLSNIEREIYRQNTEPSLRAFGPSEVGAQVAINRASDKNDAPGSILYSTKYLYTADIFMDYLRKNVFTHRALLPAIHWKERTDPGKITGIALNERTLSWNLLPGNVRYSVYAIPQSKVNEPAVFNSSEYLLGISYTPSFVVPNHINMATSTFAVAALDRYGNEYAPVLMGIAPANPSIPALVYPGNEAALLLPFTLSWEPVAQAISYIVEIATDDQFMLKVCSREVYLPSFSTINLLPLANEQTYYWRVKAKTIGNEGVFSSVRTFTPLTFSVRTPGNLAENTPLTPQISWVEMGQGLTYTLEIATTVGFYKSSMVYSGTHTTTSWEVPSTLLVGMTTYYTRVKTTVSGTEITTPVASFTTLPLVPDIPLILSPVNNSDVIASQLLITWKEDYRAKSFWIDVSKMETFPGRQTEKRILGPYNYETIFTESELSSGTYYIRILAEYNTKSESGAIVSTETAWSNVVKINYTVNTGLDRINKEKETAYVRSLSSGNKELILNLTKPAVVSASLYSVSGIKLSDVCHQAELQAGEQKFDLTLGNLPKGFYLVVLEIDGSKQILKFPL